MATITVPEAKASFDALIDRVEQGEEVVITRGGRTVARLTAAEPDQSDRQKRSLEAFGRILKQRAEIAQLHAANPITVDEILDWRDEGRR